MLIRELMTPDPVFCEPGTQLRRVAQLMVENDCGVIPVCDEGRVVGIVTDRDIVTRAFTKTLDPTTLPVSDVMTHELVLAHADDRIERAIQLMEGEQVHRLPVVDDDVLVGMISVTDLADHLPERKAGELLREVSQSPRRARMAL
jgi:CBS domain-containing protein